MRSPWSPWSRGVCAVALAAVAVAMPLATRPRDSGQACPAPEVNADLSQKTVPAIGVPPDLHHPHVGHLIDSLRERGYEEQLSLIGKGPQEVQEQSLSEKVWIMMVDWWLFLQGRSRPTFP